MHFDVRRSRSLSEAQRRLLESALGNRLTKDGILQLSSARRRSQSANRAELIQRFARLLDKALQPPRPRRTTTPSAASKEARLQHKRRRGQRKRERSGSMLAEE